ncbi:MAG TPA: hypothetical protein VG962_12085 [Steroidobacteraceae bacterium]|nr:hypothetical protein [Steroidobacteraceae bacterium]
MITAMHAVVILKMTTMKLLEEQKYVLFEIRRTFQSQPCLALILSFVLALIQMLMPAASLTALFAQNGFFDSVINVC